MGKHSVAARSPSSQVRHPWRASIRTGLAALLAALIAFPQVAAALSITDIPIVATTVAVAVGVTRVMALPSVEVFLDRFAPFLSSTGPTDDPNKPTPEQENSA